MILSIVGDADGDGTTNLVDFGILKDNFGSEGVGLSEGDFNGDTNVNLTDFSILKDNFGATGTPGDGGAAVLTGTVVYTSLGEGASVPEPSTFILAALAGVFLLVKRSRKS